MARNVEPEFVFQLMDLGAQYSGNSHEIAGTSWSNTKQDFEEAKKIVADGISNAKQKAKFLKEAEEYAPIV